MKRAKKNEPNANYWLAALPVEGELKMILVECDRWFDARRAAWSVLGHEATVVWVPDEVRAHLKLRRLQARWAGSAGTSASDLRLQVRSIPYRKKPGAWADL
jgi:hypothetical protein